MPKEKIQFPFIGSILCVLMKVFPRVIDLLKSGYFLMMEKEETLWTELN